MSVYGASLVRRMNVNVEIEVDKDDKRLIDALKLMVLSSSLVDV